jgi:excisionase family DNA binding protein
MNNLSDKAFGATDSRGDMRGALRGTALRNALAKRESGVPTYSVPEAAALLSISQEYLYRLIQADSFPAVQMSISGRQGRYVVPAKAVERILDDAVASGHCVDAAVWTQSRNTATVGGAA